MINYFKNVRSPKVLGEIEFSEFIEKIKNPEQDVIYCIKAARTFHYHGMFEDYNKLKVNELPCYTLNFRFREYKKECNIEAPTGFIYLDLDYVTNIDLTNPYIYASWKSLSGNGRGIVVRVENLSVNNFKITYKEISDYLGIDSDKYACKPSQYTVQSYDPKLYYNEEALIWSTSRSSTSINNNTPITYTYNKKEEKDVSELGLKFRYNNLDEIEFNNNPFLVFENEKYKYAELVIPREIKKGSRNTIISSIAHQCYALNYSLSLEGLRRYIYKVNSSRCDVPLPNQEIEIIVQNVFNRKDVNPILNKDRRIIYNPEANLSKNVKNQLRGRVTGKLRSKKSIQKIEIGINNWSIFTDGNISQKKLAKKVGLNIKTINKYYRLFESEIKMIKAKYLEQKKAQ